MKEFLRALLSVCGSILRYLAVSLGLMYVTLALVTGQFPPPITKYYRDLRELQRTTHMADAPTDILRYVKERDAYLGEIGGRPVRETASSGADLALQRRIDRMDVEIDRLRTRLHRAESELKRLQKKKK